MWSPEVLGNTSIIVTPPPSTWGCWGWVLPCHWLSAGTPRPWREPARLSVLYKCVRVSLHCIHVCVCYVCMYCTPCLCATRVNVRAMYVLCSCAVCTHECITARVSCVPVCAVCTHMCTMHVYACVCDIHVCVSYAHAIYTCHVCACVRCVCACAMCMVYNMHMYMYAKCHLCISLCALYTCMCVHVCHICMCFVVCHRVCACV